VNQAITLLYIIQATLKILMMMTMMMMMKYHAYLICISCPVYRPSVIT